MAMSEWKRVRDINRHPYDLEFRPQNYFWPLGLREHLLGTVKGAARRKALSQLLDEGRDRAIGDFLASPSLSESERRAFGRIHPAYLGGEFLPDKQDREIEIARITIQSVTQDVTSIYSRVVKGRYRYRVVDEYEGQMLTGKTRLSSDRPLSMRELEDFFNRTWSVFGVLALNSRSLGYRNADLLAFVAVESAFYPDLEGLYRYRICTWARLRRQELGLRDQ